MAAFPSLRRITSDGQYLAEVDGLRFVAISSVIACHIANLVRIQTGVEAPHGFLGAFLVGTLLHGGLGVPLFFTISGFILGLPFARHYIAGGKPISLRSYLLRRITRLEPPYVASLLIRTGPVMVANHLSLMTTLLHLLASLFYVHMIVFREWPVIQGVAWSLEIEIQFYLLMPLIAPLLFRGNAILRRTIVALLLPVLGIVQHFSFRESWLFHNCILSWVQFFLAGLFIADLYTLDFERIPSSWLWDALSAPLWVIFFNLTDYGSKVFGPGMLVLLFIGAFKGRLFRWFYSSAPVSIIGGMCYSLYLTHVLVMKGAAWLFFKALGASGYYTYLTVSEIVILPVALAAGALFFVLLERPCMDRLWPQHLMAFLNAKLKSNQSLELPIGR